MVAGCGSEVDYDLRWLATTGRWIVYPYGIWWGKSRETYGRNLVQKRESHAVAAPHLS